MMTTLRNLIDLIICLLFLFCRSSPAAITFFPPPPLPLMSGAPIFSLFFTVHNISCHYHQYEVVTPSNICVRERESEKNLNLASGNFTKGGPKTYNMKHQN